MKNLKREAGESMSIPEKLEHLLKGLNQDLIIGINSRMAPLIQDYMDDTDEFSLRSIDLKWSNISLYQRRGTLRKTRYPADGNERI